MGFSMNTNDLRLGPCMLTLGGLQLGGTMDGVKISLTPDFVDLKVDQYGDVAIDSVLTSQKYMIETVLAASADKALWDICMPYGKLNTSGGNKSFYMENKVGTRMSQFAADLIVHPLEKDDADLSEDFKFYKVIVKSAVEVEYGPSKQRGLKVVFSIIPDTAVSPSRYFIFGDPSIGSVAASAAAAVAGGGNVGNGTCTAQSAGSLAATETVTATCIGLDGANKSAWKVEGSVSGPIGTVEITSGSKAFTSNKVNFTLTDGATDFDVGDVFTIAVTASNYA